MFPKKSLADRPAETAPRDQHKELSGERRKKLDISMEID
jgi:hypothetical protein